MSLSSSSQVIQLNLTEEQRSLSPSKIMLPLILTALLFVLHFKNVDSGPIQETTTAPSEDKFIKALRYMKKNPETVDELMTSENALSEGDIVLSNDRNAVESIWPTHEIPYVISKELAGRTEVILSAMKMLSEHTCVTFHKKTSETNYLLFKTSKGCASYVGFIGGKQPVFVGPPCTVGNVVHEILHALGFHHEHTRLDREQYITVLSPNIMSGMERNFKKRPGETLGLPYDITSIMHYGSGFFSSNGLPTIIPNNEVKGMGQRVKLTERDVQRVQILYGCDVTKETAEESGDAEMDAHVY